MTYDPSVLVAPFGKVRLVQYARRKGSGEEFLNCIGDFPTFRSALRGFREIEELYPDLQATRREWMVFGIFNDQGSPVRTQNTNNWPHSRWDKKEDPGDYLPEIWKKYRSAQSLTYR